MDSDTLKKLVDELYPQLEALQTQFSAVLQFLRNEGIVTDEQLAPYLEQAGKASSVKWLASRLRMEHLLSSAVNEAEKPVERVEQKSEEQPEEKTEEQPAEAASALTSEEGGDKVEEKAASKTGSEGDATAQNDGQEKPGPDKDQKADAA